MKRCACNFSVIFLLLSIGCNHISSFSLKEKYANAYHSALNNPKESLKTLEDHITLSRQSGETSELGKGYYLKGWILEREKDTEKALVAYLNSLAQYEKLGQKDKQSQILENVGSIFYSFKIYDLAINYYKKAIENSEIDESRAHILRNLGLSYKSLGKYDSAQYYYLQSIDLQEELQNINAIADLYNELGIIQYEVMDYFKALTYYKDALEMTSDSLLIAKLYNNIGNTHLKTDHYDRAEPFFEMALSVKSKLRDQSQMCIYYNNLGRLHLMKGDTLGSKPFFLKSLQANNELYDENELVTTWKSLRDIYQSMGQSDSTVYYADKIQEITMPIYRQREQLELNNQKYRLELINQEYASMQKKQAWQRKLVWLTGSIFSIIMLLIATVIGYFYLKAKNENKKLVFSTARNS